MQNEPTKEASGLQQTLMARGWRAHSHYNREAGVLWFTLADIRIERQVGFFKLSLRADSRERGMPLGGWNWRIGFCPHPGRHARFDGRDCWIDQQSTQVPLTLAGWCSGSVQEAVEAVETQLEFFQELHQLSGRYTVLDKPIWEPDR